jgi:dTDP-glucose 4,6-dehydratase
MIHNALQGKKLPIYGDGKNVRDWLYVMDHAKAIDMVMEQGRIGQVYNVGGHNEKQNIEIVNLIIETLYDLLPEKDPRKAHVNKDLITYVEDRKGHDRRYAIAPDKIKSEIGWQPETMFPQGIRLTIEWYLKNTEWMNHVTSGDYQKYYMEMY